MMTGQGGDPIHIWDGCDASVAKAIRAFNQAWLPYSVGSRRYSIYRLMHELIDPAVRRYARRIPDGHPGRDAADPPGFFTDMDLSALSKAVGLAGVNRAMHLAMRRYLRQAERTATYDNEFLATCESIGELIDRCEAKAPRRTRAANHESLNGQRRHWFCELCHERSEFATFAETGQWPDAAPLVSDALRLSTRYCHQHRPKIGGEWNPEYKRALRAKEAFDIEVRRLRKQSWSSTGPTATTDSHQVTEFAWKCVTASNLTPADVHALRKLAFELTRNRVTDAKKTMVVMASSGMNQAEIARQLGISANAVSKAFKSIPSGFRFDLWPTRQGAQPGLQPASACSA